MQHMDEAAVAAAKAAALASMPRFGGGSATGGAPQPAPPKGGLHRAFPTTSGKPDAEELVRRAQRASRFATKPPSSRDSSTQSTAPQRLPPVVAWERGGSAAHEEGMAGGEVDDGEPLWLEVGSSQRRFFTSLLQSVVTSG